MKEVCDYWVDEKEKEIEQSIKRQAFEDLEEAISKLVDAINGLDEVGINCEKIDEAHIILSNFMANYEDKDNEPDYYHDRLQRIMDKEEF